MRWRRSAGLEIGLTDLKLVLSRGQGPSGWQPEAMLSELLPSGAIAADGSIDPALLGQALRRLKAGLPQGRIPIHAALPDTLMVSRYVRMPHMSAGRIRQTLILQRDQYLPFGDDRGCADFLVAADGGAAEVGVALTGLRQRTVMAVKAAFREAGLRLGSLTVAGLGLAAIMPPPPEGAPGELSAVLLATEGRLRTYVFSAGLPIGVRSLTHNAADGPRALMEVRQSLSIHGQLPATLYVVGEADGEWLDQLQRMLSRPAAGQEASPSRILPLSVPTAPAFAVAAGLSAAALAGVPDLNLLRPRIPGAAARPWLAPVLGICASLALLTAYAAWWHTERELVRTELTAVQSAPPAGHPAYLELQTALLRMAHVRPVEQSLAAAVTWSRVLEALLAARPEGVTIVSISSQTLAGRSAPEISLQGLAATFGQVDDYARKLETSGQFTGAEVRSVRRDGANRLVTFEILLPLPTGGEGR